MPGGQGLEPALRGVENQTREVRRVAHSGSKRRQLVQAHRPADLLKMPRASEFGLDEKRLSRLAPLVESEACREDLPVRLAIEVGRRQTDTAYLRDHAAP